jgi:hypothetical protein
MPKPRTPRTHIRRPKRKHKRLSRKARLLIEHVTRRHSLRQAARLLGLKNHGDLYAMKEGKIGETPEMTAAVFRAEQRARRAFLNVREPKPNVLNESLLESIITRFDPLLSELRSLLPKKM